VGLEMALQARPKWREQKTQNWST